MRTIKSSCQYCNAEFEAITKEVNRGNGKFCSRRCAASFGNNIKHLEQATSLCKFCGNAFDHSASNKASYCSHRCKNKHNLHHRKLSKDAIYLRTLPCEVCGWKEASRDLHHIVSIKKGGTNDVYNLVSLCPNDHRLADYNLISQEQPRRIVNLRTISSSEVLPSELGAVVVIKESVLLH